MTAVAQQQAVGRGWLGELARSIAGPVICGTVLIGLLAAWAAAGGAGTLTRVRLEITVAAVPMRSFTPRAAAAAGAAHTYLAIRNLTGAADKLIAVRSPIARHVVLVRRDGAGSPPVVVSALTVPAGGTLNLSPFTDDVVLEDPAPFRQRRRAADPGLPARGAGHHRGVHHRSRRALRRLGKRGTFRCDRRTNKAWTRRSRPHAGNEFRNQRH